MIKQVTKHIRKSIRFILAAVILLAGIALMIFGALQGEPHEINIIANYICLECIGIG